MIGWVSGAVILFLRLCVIRRHRGCLILNAFVNIGSIFMSKTYYYISNLKTVYNMQTGAVSSTIINKRFSGKGALYFKDIYKHNF